MAMKPSRASDSRQSIRRALLAPWASGDRRDLGGILLVRLGEIGSVAVDLEPLPGEPGDGAACVEAPREGDAEAGAGGWDRAVQVAHGRAPYHAFPRLPLHRKPPGLRAAPAINQDRRTQIAARSAAWKAVLAAALTRRRRRAATPIHATELRRRPARASPPRVARQAPLAGERDGRPSVVAQRARQRRALRGPPESGRGRRSPRGTSPGAGIASRRWETGGRRRRSRPIPASNPSPYPSIRALRPVATGRKNPPPS
jgi:hypothetical protein